ncbi:MAG TPA: NADH-quinone oxidoreductase subunit N [Candidatus Eisenbacteria bacterium]|nr:NADH-quinone oxidoreductase subunit N [Candidatus Eisenbacteria bacterium]
MDSTQSLAWFVPELILSGTVLVLIFFDLIAVQRDERASGVGIVALAGAIAAVVTSLALWGAAPTWLFGRMIVLDPFAVFFKVLLGLSLVAAILMSLGSREVAGRANEGEYYTLLVSSGLGMLLMASAGNLLMAYLSLEFVSLTSYVLTGFLRHNRRSGEAALKYLIYGGVASGAMIYGMSWIFGLTGSMDYGVIAQRVVALDAQSQGALFVALLLVLAGFGYKISAVPFHMWAPDVYTGAPIPVTAFLAVGSKAAGFAILLRFFNFGIGDAAESVVPGGVAFLSLFMAICFLTMTLGNLAALPQQNVKRLLAYSSIAHAGYALLGVVVFREEGVRAALVYLAVYYLMNLGAFWVVMLVANQTGREDVESYHGLAWRGGAAPAVALTVFLASLAGLPPLAGFIGKFYVFAAGIRGGAVALVVAGALNSVVSLYYYFRIVKAMFFEEPTVDEATLQFPPFGVGALVALATLTIVLGVYFGPLYDVAGTAMHVFRG